MKRHLGYYLSFFLIIAAGVYAVYASSSDKSLQIKFVVLMAASYIVWGVIHHAVHHSVTLRIVIEYVIVALLGIAVVFFILNGGL
jgi:hypothetical protein